MIRYRLQIAGSEEDALWTPSVTVWDDSERVACEVGPAADMAASLVHCVVLYERLRTLYEAQMTLW